MFKIVFTPTPTLKRDVNNKERFVKYAEHATRKEAELTLDTLQHSNGSFGGIYKIVDADYKLKG